MQTPDEKKQMFHDMQEHPEKYSEEQIETMMDDLDRLPDVDTAWQKFCAAANSSLFTLHFIRSLLPLSAS
ncbi:MAG: hypothetical protein IJ084_02185 [Prevotella sp.]|nr:hypothetical protein [Prevotella sp.]